MEDYLDLEGMEPGDAQEYVISVMVALKKYRKDRAAMEEELALWESRVKLATERNSEDLRLKAQEKADEIRAKIATIKVEEDDVARQVLILTDKLKTLKTRPRMNINVDYLLAQLQMTTGEPDETAEKFKGTEADAALDELKRKMGGDGTPPA